MKKSLVLLVMTCWLLTYGLSNGQAQEPPLSDQETETEAAQDVKTGEVSLQIDRADKWALWTNGPLLRGANIWQRVVVPNLDGDEFLGSDHVGPPYTQADFDRLAGLGANYVNISHPGLFTETPPYVLDEQVQTNLDRLLEMIAQADMFAVITFRTGPGRSDFTFYSDGAGDWFDENLLIESVWSDQAAQAAWAEMWRYTAARYQDNPVVVGYDLMCEPNAEGVVFDIYEPDEFYPQYANTVYDWNRFYPRLVEAIRTVDPNTPVLVGAAGWSQVRWLPSLVPTDDDHTVYAVHQYEPQTQYTHQEPPAGNSYPGEFDLDWDGEADAFNRDWLNATLSVIDGFKSRHRVPVAVNEFGVTRWTPNGAAFMDDQMDLFEQRGMNYALWVWDPAWAPFQQNNSFNFRFGPDPDNQTEVPNELMDVIIRYWTRNTIRPSNLGSQIGQARLANVSHWFYMIDTNLEPEMVNRIAAAEYDLVVLDFIPSEAENSSYPMAAVIDQLHNAPHPKLVMAYIDIGQAEDYRTYWQPDWGVGHPAWIAGGDPDGWAGNFPVAFWHEEWQDIWLGKEGYLQAIRQAGFDGVYLDWVEAYSDENVVAMAGQDGVDPRQEMIRWIGQIAEFTRAGRPDFIIIAQNAAELAEESTYLEVIDAIAQEQVWFDGGADNDPPGDCPLPRTKAEVDSRAYRNSLSPACRQQYDRFPDSTLHVSSEEYLSYLTLARDKGEIIFTVDYALEPENVAWVDKTSRGLGFVPFVGSRALDQFVVLKPVAGVEE